MLFSKHYVLIEPGSETQMAGSQDGECGNQIFLTVERHRIGARSALSYLSLPIFPQRN